MRDGEILAAAQEERFTRKKGDAGFPVHAVSYCLQTAGISVASLEAVGFYDKPLLKFERILETYLAIAPRGLAQFLKAGPVWIKEKLFTDRQLREALGALPAELGTSDGRPFEGELRYAEHHESHAASAFYPSPFEEAAILTLDGVGEWATASMGVGRGTELDLLQELRWPHSIGLLYSAFTYYTGFKVNSGEYKVMGLAPYGEPRYVDVILRELVDLREDGSFTLNQRYFNYLGGLTMTSPAFDELFGGPPREPESPLTQREMDLARSVQEVCEEIMLRMARTAHRETGLDALCLAGGVALNCVGNGRLLREGPFRRVWIQPAAGDAGGALGVAQLVWHREMGEPRRHLRRRPINGKPTETVAATASSPIVVATRQAPGGAMQRSAASAAHATPTPSALHGDATTGVQNDAPQFASGAAFALASSGIDEDAVGDAMQGSYLGPAFSPEHIATFLERKSISASQLERDELLETVAERLADGQVVGWFNGRMEFGPRSLGARSILGDPRSPRMQAQMNLKIKFRESFRPFAPSLLRERVADYFDLDCDSPYMLFVAPVKEHRRIQMTVEQQRLWGIEKLKVPRSDIPAVTHVDYSARIQTVQRDTNPNYYDLLTAFERRTGCAVLVNTSFNVRGEPIVCTPEDAYRCFMRTEMDHLVLWPYLLDKRVQPAWTEEDDWRTEFQLD